MNDSQKLFFRLMCGFRQKASKIAQGIKDEKWHYSVPRTTHARLLSAQQFWQNGTKRYITHICVIFMALEYIKAIVISLLLCVPGHWFCCVANIRKRSRFWQLFLYLTSRTKSQGLTPLCSKGVKRAMMLPQLCYHPSKIGL